MTELLHLVELLFYYLLLMASYLLVSKRVSGIKTPLKADLKYFGLALIGFMPTVLAFNSTAFFAVVLLFGYLKKQNPSFSNQVALFVATYSVVIYEIIARFLYWSFVAVPTFDKGYSYTFVGWQIIWMDLFQVAITLMFNEVLFRYVMVDLSFYQQLKNNKSTSRVFNLTILFLASYLVVQWLTYLPVYFNYLTSDESDLIRRYLVLPSAVIFLMLISILNQRLAISREKQLQDQKERELELINHYSQQVEVLYQDLRGFRHDYMNLLSSLEYDINHNNIEGVKTIFQTVIKGASQDIQSKQHDLANISYITEHAVKSLILNKYRKAKDLSLNVSIEIVDKVGKPNMDLSDFLRLLSNLLDNAIEAANSSADKKLSISYFVSENEYVLIVANSISEENSLNIEDLYREGYSSKGKGRGIGLTNVRTILSNYPSASLHTKVRSNQLIQTLVIFDK